MNYHATYACLLNPQRELIVDYDLVTLSSHLTMPNITDMEIMHTRANTNQHIQREYLLYIHGPIQRRMLPTAVAPNHNP